MTPRTSRALVLLLIFEGCATASRSSNSGTSQSGSGSGGSGNSSANSSASSANSSATSKSSSDSSGASSNQSAQSSGSSQGTSNTSNQSSQNSRGSSDANASSRDSSNATTDSPDVQTSSELTAATGLLVTTGVGVGLTIYYAARGKHPAGPEQLEKQARPAQAWLRANQRQLKIDLALGAGPTLNDLASVAEVRPVHFKRFCQVLAAHRAELLAPLRKADISLSAALQTMSRIGELTLADPELKADAETWLQHHPEAG